ncbi:hypothetical protein ANCDUO_19691, partial [Ancylostoma duodenale]
LHTILQAKVPEALPLLDELVKILTPNPREIVEAEKRSRSVVICGIPEGESNNSLSERALLTDKTVSVILDVLDIDVRPVEVYRLGRPVDDRPRLVKCVFPCHRPFFDVLKRASKLRSVTKFKDVFIRRSMTIEERKKDQQLRAEARELNRINHN